MAEYATERAKEAIDREADSEESRKAMIGTRAHELVESRMAAMEPIDIVAGLQSASEGAAVALRTQLIAGGNMRILGIMCRALIHMYIEQDSQTMARDWMDRIDAEIAKWGA